ncbi:MAG: type 1 glutamine amidotransferase, partial [Dehalococcoidia bacterium]|nr:type 1 glutamine amidotransferase [Dehalococcoidia bacterium]
HAVVIQHHRFETLGSNFGAVLSGAGYEVETVPVFEGEPDFAEFAAPDIDAVDLIVALGGPMSANDGYPALRREMEYLGTAAETGKPVLGICLGAQLLARALGGSVEPTGGYQFGLRKLWVSEEGHGDPAFSKIAIPLVPTLHGECFSIPHGATKLAEGFMLRRDGRYRRINMAFRYKNAYGVQFEPQLTLEELEVWNRELAGDYELMGTEFDPEVESRRNLREFAGFASAYEAQMEAFLRAVIGVGDD